MLGVCETQTAGERSAKPRCGFPNLTPVFAMYRAKLLLLLCLLPASASSQPAEAPNLPANLRPLIPPGWQATSLAEGDFNKDGVADRAALISLLDASPHARPPIAGLPAADRCHNLLLQLGQPNGGFTPPNFIAWPSDRDNFPQPDPTNQPEACTPTDQWESRALKAVRGTLRTELTVEIDDFLDFESNVLRVENQCLRLIGRETEHVSYPEEFRDETSINFLTRNRIDTHTTFGWNGRTEKPTERKVSKTSRIEETAPICVNNTPLLLGPAAPQSGTAAPRPVAPPSPAVAPPQQPKPPAPTPTGSPLHAPAPATQPAGPMTVEELWRNPPPGSRITWARWSDGKEESYIRLRDGTLYDRPGITVWSARGPLTLSKALHEQDATDLAACPDEPEDVTGDESDAVQCRGNASWETWSAFDTNGRVAWTHGDGSEANDEFSFEARSLEVLASDSRGILMLSRLDGDYGGAHGVEETRVWWIDAATGDEIKRPWPNGAAEAVESYYRSRTEPFNHEDCGASYFDCMESDRSDAGEPLKPIFFSPHPTCGRITQWDWTSELWLYWYARALGEWQSLTSSTAPTDIEPNPIVDCTHRPGFDGPSAVGWSAIVR